MGTKHTKGPHLRQLTIPEFLAYLDSLDTTPTVDLDAPVSNDSIPTKVELLTSAYLDKLLAHKLPLTIEEAHVLKILFELTYE